MGNVSIATDYFARPVVDSQVLPAAPVEVQAQESDLDDNVLDQLVSEAEAELPEEIFDFTDSEDFVVEGGGQVNEIGDVFAPALDPSEPAVEAQQPQQAPSSPVLDLVPISASSDASAGPLQIQLKPVDVLTGANLVASYYAEHKNPTIDDLLAIAREMDKNTEERTFDSDEVKAEIQMIDGQAIDTLNCAGEHYKLSAFGGKKLLETIKIPYGWYGEQKADLRALLLERKLAEHPAITLRTIKVGNDRVIRGVVTTNKRAMRQVELLENLKLQLEARDGSYEILSAKLSADELSFRVVLANDDRVLPRGEIYRPGIQFQNSENGYCDTLFSPAWTCVRCLNGLVDVIGQKEIVNQKNVNVPADAIRILMAKVFKYFSNQGGGELLDKLQHLIDNEIRYGLNDANKVLVHALGGVPSEFSNALTGNVWDRRNPDGVEDGFQVDAYDFINDITEFGQALPSKHRVRIEENVAGWLMGAEKKAKKVRAAR